ncbi:hypothetical protein ACLOJK_034475 [Asimina triloba]
MFNAEYDGYDVRQLDNFNMNASGIGDDDTVRAEEVIFAEDGSRFRLLTRIARESALLLAPCHRAGGAPKHCPSHVARPAATLDILEDERAPGSPLDLSNSSPTHGFDDVADVVTPAGYIAEEVVVAPISPIWSTGGEGSAGSVSKDVSRRSPIASIGSGGEVSIAAGRTGAALISESVSVVPIAHSPGSFIHINLPLLMVSDLLFNGGVIDDLNVDNVDWPLGLPGVDASILFSSFFYLVPPGRAERSPSSVHRAGSSGEGGMLEAEGPAHHRVSFPDSITGRVAVPVALIEGGAVEAIVPDSDEGSGDNSSMASSRREGSGGSSSGPTPLLDINVEFVEPFQQLKCLTRTLSSFRDEFIKGMDALGDLDELDHLLGLCGNLEHSLKTFGATLMGLPTLVQLLQRFCDYWYLSSRQITMPFAPEYVDAADYRLALEARNQQIEDRKAKVAFIDALRADLAKINAQLPSLQKAVEERGAALLMDSGRLKKAEGEKDKGNGGSS